MTISHDSTANSETPASGATAAQREQVLQRIAGVHDRLGRQGFGAAFLRAAKPDPVGDMGFLGSLFLHALVCGPINELMTEFHLPELATGDLGSALGLGGMEAASLLNETQDDRHARRPRSAFYPLGRRKNAIIKDARTTAKKFNAVSAGKNSRYSYEVQAELAGMFDLMDLLSKLDEQGAQEAGRATRSHWVHLKPSAPAAYKGAERRRHARPEGMFSA